MGSCISSHNHKQNSGSSKLDQIMSNNYSSIPSTPVKVNDKPTNNLDPPIISFASKHRISPFNSVSSYRSLGGSKDETFFDTQGWLDSDCDDDFYSVNGDFTPSRCSTPGHGTGTPRLSRVFSPQVSRALFDGKPPRSGSNLSRGSTSIRQSFSSAIGSPSHGVGDPNPLPSSTTKSKKLIELFRESMRERDGLGLLTPSSPSPPTSSVPSKQANKAPSSLRFTVVSSDKTIHVDDDVAVKEKPEKFTHRCFPRLSHVRSFRENKNTDGTKS